MDALTARVAPLPAAIDIALSGKAGGIFRLTITRRVFLVGAIPIVFAVILGVVSMLLFDRADGARRDALIVSTAFRNVVLAMGARDDYLDAAPASRSTHLGAFMANIGAATTGLAEIGAETDDPDNADAISATIGALERFRRAMGELEIAVDANDQRARSMEARLDRLITLAEEARGRQQSANSGVVEQLRKSDSTLGNALDLAAAAVAMRQAVLDRWVRRLRADAPPTLAGAAPAAGTAGQPAAAIVPAQDDHLADARLANAAETFRAAFRAAGRGEKLAGFDEKLAQFRAGNEPDALVAFLDRCLKVDGSAVQASQQSFAGLLDSVVAAQTAEQAAQNIAVETIRLSERTREAMRRRDGGAIQATIAGNDSLREAIAGLPISPLVQSEMLDALDAWRRALSAARDGLAAQDAILRRMAFASSGIVFEVSNLNATLSKNADATGRAARQILAVSAAICLIIALAFGLAVARSITQPLKRLQEGMLARAADPAGGPLPEADRGDEIGRMTRATNHFLAELGKREAALRVAKDETERALAELKRTQSNLIQSEKLASLGQLVAGIAHEINTPLGVAVTTATVMREETERFRKATAEGKVTRQAFDDFIRRTGEGADLVDANLERAAGLVSSFKKVAADQASGERRSFRMDEFVTDLFRSLGPLRKRYPHEVAVDCEEDIAMSTYPGALSQVLTNLLTNSYAHAFGPGESGRIDVGIRRHGDDRVRITFADDGRGIAGENLARIFDPFFTTGRGSGSTGLGLHIVYNLVTVTLGGVIVASSELGGGTRFVIDVPRVRQAPAAAEAAEATEGGPKPAGPTREARPSEEALSS
ncbi:sensor histidine kinase [Jiella sonneratiae]|uniref:histidine kinase n=1 Tax=Jiella sonneratiae TaxID=2816856 RepID=A0ABS3J3S6_9HYPH|nr:HAMP domain-containing sensor histidine kinase [Jiella sonneratiae]MBO0904317.1 HAMP domain-containing protein [Jiella sonneratiae]